MLYRPPTAWDQYRGRILAGLAIISLQTALIAGLLVQRSRKRAAEEQGRGGGTVEPELVNKHRVFAFGPDVTLPVATKTKLIALVNLRYLWEAGARSKTEGSTFTVMATFPIPSVKLQ